MKLHEQHLARAEGRASPTRSATCARSCDVDSHEVMDIFCRDEKLNLSPYYLKPGFAFGGSCLPEGRAGAAVSRQGSGRRAAADLADPAEQHGCRSSTRSIRCSTPARRTSACSGFSFKAGTDDLRESPIVILAEALLGKGVSLEDLRQERVDGQAGRSEQGLHRSSRSRTCRRCSATRSTRSIDGSEVIVVGNQAPEFAEAVDGLPARSDQSIDLVRLPISGSPVDSRLPRHLLVERCAPCSICHEDAALDREGLVRWLGSFSTFCGTVVIREPGGRLRKRISREVRRVGWWRFLDVLAFRAVPSPDASRQRSTMGGRKLERFLHLLSEASRGRRTDRVVAELERSRQTFIAERARIS